MIQGSVFQAHPLFPAPNPILLQCNYSKVPAGLKILPLLLDAWPKGHLLSGTSKLVTEQPEKLPPVLGECVASAAAI